MRVLVSLAVHEQVEVVVNQVQNLLRYLDDPVIVLHVSRDFDVQAEDFIISDRVMINPVRLSTAWGSGILVLIHMLNVRYALSQIECDYVTFHASNDLFVRNGVEAWMNGHAAGGRSNAVNAWNWAPGCLRDRPLQRFLEEHNLITPLHGQLEGSFYRIDIFGRMLRQLDRLERNVSWPHLSKPSLVRRKLPFMFRDPHYPREEVYFPTALAACGVRPTADPYVFMNWNHNLGLSREDVDAVRRRDYSALSDYKVTGANELFAVKRVLRQIDDPLRKYINGLDNKAADRRSV